ncbi:MAG: hypothetical protein II354_04855 [Firmicutes bacterium]|nr:hypothetical protein [Bacillota bacterium]
MGNQYGPYVMYVLSQLLQKRQAAETGETEMCAGGAAAQPSGLPAAGPGPEARAAALPSAEQFFAADETGAVWHRETNLELLKQFCREGYALALRHGHFIIGSGAAGSFIGIPGRFLLEDQPAGGRTGFTLWQPLRGGEALYGGLEDMDETTAHSIYGYWIAALDSKTLEISEF